MARRHGGDAAAEYDILRAPRGAGSSQILRSLLAIETIDRSKRLACLDKEPLDQDWRRRCCGCAGDRRCHDRLALAVYP